MPATIETTPHASTFDLKQNLESTTTVNVQTATPANPLPECPPPQPSIRLLFSLVPRRDFYLIVLPAILTSMLAGGVAPFMTYVVGESFNAFANFPTTPNPSESAKTSLLHGVGLAAIELVALAAGALALSSITSSLWIWTGERNLMAVRKRVYAAVTQKDMVWFDTKMGAEDSIQAVEGDGPLGAGGLMAKFARETDEVRMASSLASGFVIQYLTTSITCLILAFVQSWSLTLVILSAVPVLVIIQTASQIFAGAHLSVERATTATAATLVDRAVAAIATVKAFNAETHEQESIGRVLDAMQVAANKCITVWGITSSLGQFVMMAMFVQAFWFGSKLVRDGTITPGTVMSVFWACLIATSNLQMCIPQIIVLSKGKFSIAALLALVESAPASPLAHSNSTVYAPLKPTRRPTQIRKIVPGKCRGEFELDGVTFAYPSRPTMPVLQDVSIFLPSNEMSFIVGGSGSGKSTVAQLLLRMYATAEGAIRFDDQDVNYLDEDWMRSHVAAISQGCILFDMTVHENVAMGLAYPGSCRRPEDVTRAEVEKACRIALMDKFVEGLSEGYDTRLGNGGANLSGGQRQRLAIARALLRNPTVLILDEATSALDANSRILVFEAIKRQRANMTTIVITHDLSQIEPENFVYVLKSGQVVEQGFRNELESFVDGEFRKMFSTQEASGGFQEKSQAEADAVPVGAILEQQDVEMQEELAAMKDTAKALKHRSVAPAIRPLTLGNWMFEAVADLTKPSTAVMPKAVLASRDTQQISRFVPQAEEPAEDDVKQRRRKTLHIDIPSIASPPPTLTSASHRYSLQFTPTSPTLYSHRSTTSLLSPVAMDDEDFDLEKAALQRTAIEATSKRPEMKRARTRWDEKSLAALAAVKVESCEAPAPEQAAPEAAPQQSFWSLIRDIYPTIPNKPLLVFGMLCCLASGAMTPVFSFLLSRVFFEVSIGAKDVSTINMFGGIVLAVAAADGLFIGLKYAIMEVVAMSWVNRVRKVCLARLLAQDKKWFDKTDNSAVRLVQILIKDGDDARSLIATVLAQAIVVSTMLGLGLIWALVRGWQLTLVGFAIAPVFAISMAVQTNLVAKCEMRNKRAREEVAKGYYDAISNIRGIRAMGFESAFRNRFEQSVDSALSMGVRGAFVEGCSYGVASALIYLAEALLFYVGAVLIARGTYSYLQMVQTLNLVVFSVSIGSQLMGFTQRIAKSIQATRDFNVLIKLSTFTDESRGVLRPEIHGAVSFNNVSFAYPERADVPVLKDLSLEVAENECVALVGASGCGKSTITALLQRLYEPNTGSISIGLNELRSTDVHHLRDHVAVVSQHPNLFDATITENIAYGNKSLSFEDVQRAAEAANVHDFIKSLPKGYDTLLGENASLISGGQAQRLQIARALARPARILILDECTSALDAENQAAIMGTIARARVGRTTLVVTHKLQMMRMCDRIVVVHDGVVAEEGTYEVLMERRGVFAQLASGGEWTGD